MDWFGKPWSWKKNADVLGAARGIRRVARRTLGRAFGTREVASGERILELPSDAADEAYAELRNRCSDDLLSVLIELGDDKKCSAEVTCPDCGGCFSATAQHGFGIRRTSGVRMLCKFWICSMFCKRHTPSTRIAPTLPHREFRRLRAWVKRGGWMQSPRKCVRMRESVAA